MAQCATSAELIVEAIMRHPGCGLDELVALCPALTWNQIFLEVDRLSRAGRLRVKLSGRGRYTLALQMETDPCVSRPLDASGRPAASTQTRHDATCGRCGGLMVSEDDGGFNGWRCILCGERIDPMIQTQRRRAESAGLRAAHAGR